MTRELFSYRFPAEGLKGSMRKIIGDWRNIREHAVLLAELAQFNSECLHTECAGRKLDLSDQESEELLETFYYYEHRADEIVDNDDYYRLGYALRKGGHPRHIDLIATDGLLEDFFGGWHFKENANDYNPDDYWTYLLDFS